jgi:hypothetical protein
MKYDKAAAREKEYGKEIIRNVNEYETNIVRQ